MKNEIQIQETEITTIGPEVRIEGNIEFSGTIRVYGALIGTIKAKEKSLLILMESSSVEGQISGDEIIIAGLTKGEITASGKVSIESSGRVIGKVHAKSFTIDFGAYIDGEIQTQSNRP